GARAAADLLSRRALAHDRRVGARTEHDLLLPREWREVSNRSLKEKRATSWGTLVAWDTVCRRASGHRRYNSLRRYRAALRRHEIVEHARAFGLVFTRRGTCARLARQFGLHPSTVLPH